MERLTEEPSKTAMVVSARGNSCAFAKAVNEMPLTQERTEVREEEEAVTEYPPNRWNRHVVVAIVDCGLVVLVVAN